MARDRAEDGWLEAEGTAGAIGAEAERRAPAEARGGEALRRPRWEDMEPNARGQEMCCMLPA